MLRKSLFAKHKKKRRIKCWVQIMALIMKGNIESLAFSVILHFKIKATGSSSQRHDTCNTIWLLKIQDCLWAGLRLHWSQVSTHRKMVSALNTFVNIAK